MFNLTFKLIHYSHFILYRIFRRYLFNKRINLTLLKTTRIRCPRLSHL